MLEKLKDLIKNSRILQLVLALLAGVAVGAIFYPTKHIEETLTTKHQAEITQLKEQHAKEVSEVQEKLNKVSGESKSIKMESEKKISQLTTQIKTLNSKNKTTYYKIVRPDGTVEVRKSSETDLQETDKVVTQIQEEFKTKVASIEQKWETIHKERIAKVQKDFSSKESEYKKEIDELKQTKVVDINKKSLGLELGGMSSGNIYVHPTYDIFGPIFVGVQGEVGLIDLKNSAVGMGVGVRL